MTIPIDDSPFTDLAAREQAQVLGTAEHYFFGLKMQQHPRAPEYLNRFLNLVRPRNIVEIGAGECGLSVLFALYAINTGGRYGGFDIIDGKHKGTLEKILPGAVQKADVLTNEENVKALQATLSSLDGVTCLYCDAGKAIEARLYIPHLKRGDWVLMHDHSPTHETFERDMKGRHWNWHESWDERVADVCEAHGVVQTTALHSVAWFCGVKTL